MIKDYINYEKVENLKKVSILMIIIILGAIFVIYINNLYLTGDALTQTIQVIFNISVPCAVAVAVCHLGDRISNKWKYLVGVYLIVALYINFFQVQYFDDPLHLWAVSYCAVPLIGQIMTVFNVIESFLVLTKKYLKVLDLICLLDFIIGVGGVVYFVYTGSFIYTVHYALSHIPFAFMFLFMYPDKGLTDIFCYDSVLSNSLLRLFAAIGLGIPLLTIIVYSTLKGIVFISLFSLYTIVCCAILVIIWLFILLYARQLNEDDVKSKKDLENLNATVEDVQEATSVSIHYKKANGEHIWTPETYKLIERDPRPEDKFNHIILDLASPEDQDKFNKLFDGLKPNEFLGVHELSITCENGKVKYLQVDSKKLYDNDGNFIQKSGYAMDITQEVLNNREIERLNATVEEVQEAASISVHYMDAEGIHHWTPATYKIIEREPREEDKYNDIILDLASPEDQKLLRELWNDLKPNEFLGAHDLKITLENGKVKHLQVDARRFYDDKSIFIQQSAYAMDVTKEWIREHDLIKADAEKTVLVKEVHHRVKNNLQTITSLISLEERFETSSDKILNITKSRISALALIHETIYNELDMNYITLNEFFPEFDNKLKSLATHPDIEFVENIENLTLNIDSVTPLVLMTNELTTNSFKHAFEDTDEDKKITKIIKAYEDNGIKMCEFHYKDNGRGLPEGFDIESSGSLGWTIVNSLTAQLEGEYELFNDDGFNFVLKFPIVE